MSDNLLQRSVTTSVARNLTNTSKTSPKMMSITPRWILDHLPWVQVEGGTYRVNRTRVELPSASRIGLDMADFGGIVAAEALRNVPLFSRLSEAVLARIGSRFRVEDVSLGNKLAGEGEDLSSRLVSVVRSLAMNR